MRSDHGHLTAYQIGCEVGQSVGLVLRPAVLDRHILALDVAGFTKALAECGQIACTIDGPRATQESDHRHCALLRARGERPRRAAAPPSRVMRSRRLMGLTRGQGSQLSIAGLGCVGGVHRNKKRRLMSASGPSATGRYGGGGRAMSASPQKR